MRQLLCFLICAGVLPAAGVQWDTARYRPVEGIAASVSGDGVAVTWRGEGRDELRLRVDVERGAPVIREIAFRRAAGRWSVLMRDAAPVFRVSTGRRRITNQQLDPLAGLGIPITREVIEKYKWDAFWDAPLNVPGGDEAHANNTPPQRGVLHQPGLPRKAEEVHRAAAEYQIKRGEVAIDGARLEISFDCVKLGVFAGRLQFTVYRGSNLIRQELIAKTDAPSVAYRYESGWKGEGDTPVFHWRDPFGTWHSTSDPTDAVPLAAANRTIALEVHGGSIVAFPPPHSFFWARESSSNLGYSWLARDGRRGFSFGVRQPEREDIAWRMQNFALVSARPGTWQRMPMFLYISPERGPAAVDAALRYTRGDRFQKLPGYAVMAAHFHMSLTAREQQARGRIPDLEVMKSAGVQILAPIDNPNTQPSMSDETRWMQWSRLLGARTARPEPARATGAGYSFRGLEAYYAAAARLSDAEFVVMPNTEILRGDVARAVGGHADLIVSHPVYWSDGRDPGQALTENRAPYGTVYHLGSADDLMEMARRENLLLFMPHPRTKGSTGYPDAIKDAAHWNHDRYRGIGFRWGMGLDGSEQRLSEYRCLPLWDEINNWSAAKGGRPKLMSATSELYSQSLGDDAYANNPVNYVRLERLPRPGEWGPIVDAMNAGEFFVTSGEVLIPRVELRDGQVAADVEWTFPLEMVEIVWGDGREVGRTVVRATDLGSFGKKTFTIPFAASGKKWVRFAAWDCAGNGAMGQPMRVR